LGATLSDLRRGLVALGFGNLPTSANHVKELVMEEGERVRSFMMAEMATLKKQGRRFSVTFDECTSTSRHAFPYSRVPGTLAANDGTQTMLALLEKFVT